MKSFPKVFSCLITLFASSMVAHAGTLLLDRSPDAFPGSTPYFSAANSAGFQHFAQRFSFGTDVSLDGMAIYSGYPWGAVGQTVTIELWNDNAGDPGTSLRQFQETIAAIDFLGATNVIDPTIDFGPDPLYINRKLVNFTNPLNLSANVSYWIGMAGGTPQQSEEIAMEFFWGMNGFRVAQLYFDPVTGIDSSQGSNSAENRGIAMQLYGTAGSQTVPDSSTTFILLGLTGAGMAFLRRKIC